MAITHVNPASLFQSPYFSQGVIIESGRTLYIGGQNGADAQGEIHGDIAQQSELASRNVLAVIEAAGGTLADLVKLTVIMVDGHDLNAAYQAGMTVLGGFTGAITVLKVAALGRPEALIEIEGIANLPEVTSNQQPGSPGPCLLLF